MAKATPTQPDENNGQPGNQINRTQVLSIIFGFLGVVVTALVGYLGIRAQIYAPVGITQTAQAIYETQTMQSLLVATSAIAQTLTPTTTLTLTPSLTPTSTATATKTPEPKVVFIVPNEDELYSLPVLHYDYINSIRPATRTYDKTVQSNESFLWKYFWCAKYENALQKNLREVNFEFMVDDVIVPEDNFRKYRTAGEFGGTSEDWSCQAWATILSQWSQGNTVKLSVFYYISRPISDGENNYQPGNYRHDIFVSVE